MREKGWEERARNHTRKTLVLVPLWFRYSLVSFQTCAVAVLELFRNSFASVFGRMLKQGHFVLDIRTSVAKGQRSKIRSVNRAFLSLLAISPAMVPCWVHHGRSDAVANANANSEAHRKFTCEFATKSQRKSCESSRVNKFASDCEWFCKWNRVNFVLAAEIPCEWLFATSNLLAIANAMAWCTQVLCRGHLPTQRILPY